MDVEEFIMDFKNKVEVDLKSKTYNEKIVKN